MEFEELSRVPRKSIRNRYHPVIIKCGQEYTSHNPNSQNSPDSSQINHDVIWLILTFVTIFEMLIYIQHGRAFCDQNHPFYQFVRVLCIGPIKTFLNDSRQIYVTAFELNHQHSDMTNYRIRKVHFTLQYYSLKLGAFMKRVVGNLDLFFPRNYILSCLYTFSTV